MLKMDLIYTWNSTLCELLINDFYVFNTWFTSNFSLQYPLIIQQTGNENTQMYQVEVVILI